MNKLSSSSAARREARAVALAERNLLSLRRTTATTIPALPARPSRPRGATPPSNGRYRKTRPHSKTAALGNAPATTIRKRSKSSELRGTSPRAPVLPRSITEGGLLNGGEVDAASSPVAERHKPRTPKGSGERFRGRPRRVSPQQFAASAAAATPRAPQRFASGQAEEPATAVVPEPLSRAEGDISTHVQAIASRGELESGTYAAPANAGYAVPTNDDLLLASVDALDSPESRRRREGNVAGHSAAPSEAEAEIPRPAAGAAAAAAEEADAAVVSGFLRPHASGFLRPHAFASAGEEPAEEIEDPFALNDAMLKERLEQAKAKPSKAFGFALWNKGKAPSAAAPAMAPSGGRFGEEVSASASEVRINSKDNELRTAAATDDTDDFRDPDALHETRHLSVVAMPAATSDMHRRLVDVKADTPRQFQWRLGEQIGRGSFGRVFRGLNERTGELFAVKQVPLHDENTKDAQALVTEITLMKGLEHDHIVRYLGTQMLPEQGLVCIFMEYVPGGSIASMLAQFGVFKEDLIRRYIEQVLLGLKYLHGMGIVHRDIKGANILVSNEGACKLSDFGMKPVCSRHVYFVSRLCIAHALVCSLLKWNNCLPAGCSKQLQGMRTTSFDASTKAISGSVPWMAPEVIKRSGYGRASDIWSAGATMIEMATASQPWPNLSNNFSAILRIASTTEPPPIPTSLSESAQAFLRRCLHVDAKDRPPVEELLTTLF
jgi:hypothetical protein